MLFTIDPAVLFGQEPTKRSFELLQSDDIVFIPGGFGIQQNPTGISGLIHAADHADGRV